MASGQNCAIGEEVKVYLDGRDEVFQGTVFCCDKKSDILVLEEPHPQSTLKKDVRMIKLSMVRNVETVRPAPRQIEKLPTLKVDKIKQREKEALERARRELNRLGKGVTKEAQDLFDILSKTYNCRWKGKSIECLQLGVEIVPPYKPGNCKGKDSNALKRIQKLVDEIMLRHQKNKVSEA